MSYNIVCFLPTSSYGFYGDNSDYDSTRLRHSIHMNWQFTDTHILTEATTGFMVCLLRGSWSQVEEIKPIAPKGIDFKAQAQLLREALAFAELYVANTRDADLFSQASPLYEVIEMSDYRQAV